MKEVSFIAGDKRNLILSKLFEEDGFCVHKSSLGTEEDIAMDEAVKKSNIIITAIPFSNDGINVNAKLSENAIEVEKFIALLNNKTIVGGKFSEQITNRLKEKNNIVLDIMKDNNLAEKNAIPTVEGVVKIIIEHTNKTIDGSNIAIIGFGRVGKRAAKILSQMGAKIFCADTNQEEVANIKLCGYNVIENIKNYNEFDIILNTVPCLVIGKDELEFISKQTLLIDISSKPGGIDFEYAKENRYNVIHELGIPGKVAPYTAAKYMYDIIKEYIKRGENDV